MRSRDTRELPDKSVELLASDTRANVKFKLSCTVHGRSADTKLADIHEEMSELLDKQMNVQNEGLKKTSGQAPASP